MLEDLNLNVAHYLPLKVQVQSNPWIELNIRSSSQIIISSQIRHLIIKSSSPRKFLLDNSNNSPKESTAYSCYSLMNPGNLFSLAKEPLLSQHRRRVCFSSILIEFDTIECCFNVFHGQCNQNGFSF